MHFPAPLLVTPKRVGMLMQHALLLAVGMKTLRTRVIPGGVVFASLLLSYRKSYTLDQHHTRYTRDEGKFLQRIVHSLPMPQRSLLLLIIIMLKGAKAQFQLPTTHHAPPRDHDELSAQPNRYLTLVFWANETTTCHERENFHAVKKTPPGKVQDSHHMNT